jgi:cytochrome P450
VTKQILLQRSTITSNEFTYWVMEKFFGNKGGIRSMDPTIVFGKVHEALYQLNREPFVSNAAAVTGKLVQDRIYNLISFAPSWVDQSIWERAAKITVDPSGTTAEASLFPLMRYFVGDFASTILMGQDFMTNNPTILPDLFTFDGSFTKFLVTFPWWFPGMAPAYQARDRLVRAIRDHQEALYAVWEDRDPGIAWSDMSDVSKVMQDRAREWRSMRADPDDYSTSDTAIFWAMNVNANQLTFWMLWHVYQRPTLRAELLAEIAPFATLRPVKSDLPIPEPPKLTLDLDGLVQQCPLFKATFYETLRLESPSTSYKAVVESFNITESAEDAALDGKTQPQTYRFEKGSYICIPYGVHSMDSRYWKDPQQFNPRRFFVVDDEEKKTKVDVGSMRVFGGGATMCKGRNFAEREVLIVVAAVLTGWDVEPVGGKWTDPGRVGGSGAFLPKRDIRVRMRRREVGE